MRLAALLAVVLLQSTACATLTNEPPETIGVRSDPSGADAVIECDDGVRGTGTTPARIEIPRQADGCVLTVTHAGMTTERVELRRDISNKFWGPFWTGVGATAYLALAGASGGSAVALIFGLPPAVFGLGSAAVDVSSERRWSHDPDEIDLKMKPAQ